MKLVNKILFAIFSIVLMATLPLSSFAAETAPQVFKPEIAIPGLQNLPNDSSLMARYIRVIYIFFVWIVGLLAVIMIIYGGVRWVAAAGNAGQIKEARDIVTNALAGVVLALLSVVILRTINPDLVNLQPLTLRNVDPYALGLGIIRTCSLEEMDGPGLLDTSDTKCGQVKKLESETAVDANGKKIDAYCISTQCKKDEVCSLGMQTFKGLKYFTPGSGCLKNIAFDPPITTEGGKTIPAITSVVVKNDLCADPRGDQRSGTSGQGCVQDILFGCGEVDWDTFAGVPAPDFVSNRCPEYENKNLTDRDKYSCYIIGKSGKEGEKSKGGSSKRFVFKNMSCNSEVPGGPQTNW